ncbi:M15 family metallopeptidase [Nocardiopsis trehalosi]|jgi:septal ring factor EnvC (AmiA/AmiB activator)|uniref:M15 family metallopeptidase n=1 Tax=Nocardiopsis trehalosi TaxID=109329 RepID=UPI000A01969B|nr:M15 family metallopeptidase [Nocardiopsis trehalosi]
MRHRAQPSRRRGRAVPGAAAAALALALGAAGAGTARAEPDAVEQSRRQEDAYAASIGELTTRLAEVRAELDGLQASADEAILAYGDAADRLGEAERAHRSAERAADRAAEHREAARGDAAQYAVAAYKGGGIGPAVAWTAARGPQEVVDRTSYLDLLSGRQDDVLNRADASSVAADTLDDRAADAAAEQRRAADEAADAKDEALGAVAEQQDALADILAEQSELELRLAEARDDTEELERRREAALDRASAAAGGTAQEAGGGTAEAAEDAGDAAPAAAPGCTSSGTGGYANGRLPDEVLCPLPQSGERLRADAAAAFIELDGAFRERFGRPMCVADSYRPLHEQVRLFHEMRAGMAAAPGTSTHGWGLAVDLCGGVNVHGSAEYTWMMANAPAHGWHNPPWARGGFEPWHWEFSG